MSVPANADTIVDYSAHFNSLKPEQRLALEADLYSRHYTPMGRAATDKERIDAYIIRNFTLSAIDKYGDDPSSFSQETAQSIQSMRQAQAVFYALYDVPGSQIDSINDQIENAQNSFVSDLFKPIPVLGTVSYGMSLKKIQDLETKKMAIKILEPELPNAIDIQKIYTLARVASKNLPAEYSELIDAYFEGNPAAISIQAGLNALISHNLILENYMQNQISDNKLTSLDDTVAAIQKDIKQIEDKADGERKKADIERDYQNLRQATAGLSSIFGFFDRQLQSDFNKISAPLIDLSQSYSKLKKIGVKGFSLNLETLGACASGIGAVFAIADFFVSSSRPNEMAIIIEHLNTQFEKLHERFDKLHEHIALVHRDLIKAYSELFYVMQKRFDSTDIQISKIRAVLNKHTQKLQVIENLIREHRDEARNIDIDQDYSKLKRRVRQYNQGSISIDDCLFDCVTFSEETAKRRPHLKEKDDNLSDIRNGFFHKFLSRPYYSNLRQLLQLSYPDLPRESQSQLGVYESEVDRALKQYIDNGDPARTPPFTLDDIRNIRTWATGVNESLNTLSKSRPTSQNHLDQKRILENIGELFTSGKKIKASLQSIFYEINSDFEKISVRRPFVRELLRNYVNALTQTHSALEQKTAQYYVQNRLSGLDIWAENAVHNIPESFSIPDMPLSVIFPSEIKAAVLLGVGNIDISYGDARWAMVNDIEGRLMFNTTFSFQERNQEPKILGVVTILSDNAIPNHKGVSPKTTLDDISPENLANLIIRQIQYPAPLQIQRQYVMRDHTEKKRIYKTMPGKEFDRRVFVREEEIHSRVYHNTGGIIRFANELDLSAPDITEKAETKLQDHTNQIKSEIAEDIQSENTALERLDGQKALLKAFLTLGLNQSFKNHLYLKSFFNKIFSHELFDKTETAHYLAQTESTPHGLLKEGLIRIKKLSCLLLGRDEGVRAIEAFETIEEERCINEELYTDEGLLSEKIDDNELPDILSSAWRALYKTRNAWTNQTP